jgi:hypothetical protein
VRLAGAYTNGNLSPETVDMMFESQRLQSGKETGVGIAWRSGYDVFGQRTLEHAGSMEGTRTVVALYPDSRFAVALMTNTDWNSLIEETAHMIALPFLFASSPAPQPTGTAEVTITVAKANGTKEVKTGALSIGNGRGSLVVDPGSPTQLTYPLIYLERGNSYAMVRPDGIVHLTMAVEADSVVGRAIGYGSPRLTPPSSDPPFFTFRGSFVRTKVSAPKHG